MYQSFMAAQDLTTYSGKHDRFIYLSGLAVLNHLNGLVNSAVARWEKAFTFCKGYAFRGFTEIIIAYSIGELELQQDNRLEADYLRAKASLFFTSTGRQYYFLGLGSAWLDILGRWYESRGCDRIAPQRATARE